jgi:A/G-specific adenine glycosylase
LGYYPKLSVNSLPKQAANKRNTASIIREEEFNKEAFALALITWFERNGREFPWRRTQDPYAIWISEMMLQQTQAAAVITYFESWIKKFPTLETLAAASEEEVLRAWEGLGYYSRARNLHGAAKQIVAQFAGKVPNSPAVLQNLPGIGQYTAGAIAAFAFDLPVPVVDTNVARVLARVFDFREPIDRPAGLGEIWNLAEQLAQGTGGRQYTSAIMELGALLCTPRKPQCLICPVKTFCRSDDPESLPVKGERPAITRVTQRCAVLRRKEHLFLSKSAGKRWKGMWLFPEIATAAGAPIATLEFSITRYKVTLEAYACERSDEPGVWHPLSDLASLPMPAPHRRLLTLLLELQNGG